MNAYFAALLAQMALANAPIEIEEPMVNKPHKSLFINQQFKVPKTIKNNKKNHLFKKGHR